MLIRQFLERGNLGPAYNPEAGAIPLVRIAVQGVQKAYQPLGTTASMELV